MRHIVITPIDVTQDPPDRLPGFLAGLENAIDLVIEHQRDNGIDLDRGPMFIIEAKPTIAATWLAHAIRQNTLKLDGHEVVSEARVIEVIGHSIVIDISGA